MSIPMSGKPIKMTSYDLQLFPKYTKPKGDGFTLSEKFSLYYARKVCAGFVLSKYMRVDFFFFFFFFFRNTVHFLPSQMLSKYLSYRLI